MAATTPCLLALLLLYIPLLASCTTCGFREVYEAESPQPEKCWECPEISDAFEHGKTNIDRVGKSYDNFFCKYTISGYKKITYPIKEKTDRINQCVLKDEVSIYCYYGKNGRINDRTNSSRRCRERAIAVPNCTPVKFTNYTGPYEVCCRPGCQLETPGRCFHCPIIGGDFVDVDIKPGFPIECTYHGLGGPLYRAVTRCYFDPETGKAVSGYNREEPCESDGKTAVAGQRDSCQGRLPTCPRDCKSLEQCWKCPQKAGKVVTEPKVKIPDLVSCIYKDAKAPSLGELNCFWDQCTGQPLMVIGTNGNSDECPKTPACVFDK